MKSIKQQHNGWMLFIAILLLCFAGLLFVLSKRGVFTPEHKEYIMRSEVMLLTDALLGQVSYEKMYEGDTPITYEELKEYLKFTKAGENYIESTLQKNKAIDETAYDTAYVDHEVWNDIWEQLLKDYNDGSISYEKAEVVFNSQREETVSGKLLTEVGNYFYCLPAFDNAGGYQVEGYVKEQGKNKIFLTLTKKSPVKAEAKKCLVLGNGQQGTTFFYQGEKVILPVEADTKNTSEIIPETIADVTVEKNQVVLIQTKNEKINDKVLEVEKNQITLENLGTIEVAENMQIYQIYDTLQNGTLSDIIIGYRFVDFVMEDGKICACLITRTDSMEEIRVLIKSSDFASNYHEKAEFTCDTDFEVTFVSNEDTDIENSETVSYKAGEKVSIIPDSFDRYRMILITPVALTGKTELFSVERSLGTPSYRGNIEIRKKDEGMVLINTVLLEEYLYGVVPSEMTPSYEGEALKAQAVCARTYAYEKMINAGLSELGAHVDDSTAYQVYNNVSENPNTTEAVRETNGKVLLYEGIP